MLASVGTRNSRHPEGAKPKSDRLVKSIARLKSTALSPAAIPTTTVNTRKRRSSPTGSG